MGTLGLVGLGGLAGTAGAAEECKPARTLLVLDKSSSMVTGSVGPKTKWQIAVDAIGGVTQKYETSVEVGLMMFPDPGECSPGTVSVPPALQSRGAVMAALADPPPTGGNWTPIAQSLDAAGDSAELMGTDSLKAVILITDGWQYCVPYDEATRFDPVDAVERLGVKGVRTYVVGFGDGVDVLTLNKMAVKAGTEKTGCNRDTEDVNAPDLCFHDAADEAELLAALEEIAGAISVEECDGVDNDCDGTVDEGCACPEGETRACGSDDGVCEAGTQTCTAGTWTECTGVAPAAETCDALDNDCDGATDEDDGTLCPGGGTCDNGACTVAASYGDSAGGCACRVGERRTGGANVGLAGVLLGLLSLVALRRRTR